MRRCGPPSWTYLSRIGASLPAETTSLMLHQVGTCPWPLPNVWLGTSIESDEYCWGADELRAAPAAVRFLSLEPLLGPLPSLNLDGIDWVICGGESGPNARPMHPDWARSLRDQCQAAGIPFHFKQRGEWTWDYPNGINLAHRAMVFQHLKTFYRVGKKIAGRLLDGKLHDEYPSENTQ